jgi:hypothetical protein
VDLLGESPDGVGQVHVLLQQGLDVVGVVLGMKGNL